MATSNVWIIEPRDPFIARDGKPFGVGVSAATLPFPFPSTTTGGVRTRAGLTSGSFQDGNGDPNKKLIEQVRKIEVAGALLVELNEQGEIQEWFMPAPCDALLEAKGAGDKVRIKRLLPLDIGKGITNLDQVPHENDKLAPVGSLEFGAAKPFDKAPRFWRWENLSKWLSEPDKLPLALNPKFLGHSGAVIETRTHVAIDPETLTAQENQLFQTRGLEFTLCNELQLADVKRLAFAVSVGDCDLAQRISTGLAPLGGERRTVAWRKSSKAFPRSPALEQVVEAVLKQKTRACRLVLLTPAFFESGSRPTRLLSEEHGVKIELQAIANNRAQVISGWDLEIRKPKPTRRLAPAGSVLFLRFVKGNDLEITQWLERTWMSCVSDDAPDGDKDQYRHDGFGLAALGVWDGQLRTMKV
jgi:CRISPR-associated protein Cmr3